MDNTQSFGIGLILGLGLSLILFVSLGTVNLANRAYKVIEQCQAELPRNQSCKLTAIPESKERS